MKNYTAKLRLFFILLCTMQSNYPMEHVWNFFANPIKKKASELIKQYTPAPSGKNIAFTISAVCAGYLVVNIGNKIFRVPRKIFGEWAKTATKASLIGSFSITSIATLLILNKLNEMDKKLDVIDETTKETNKIVKKIDKKTDAINKTTKNTNARVQNLQQDQKLIIKKVDSNKEDIKKIQQKQDEFEINQIEREENAQAERKKISENTNNALQKILENFNEQSKKISDDLKNEESNIRKYFDKKQTEAQKNSEKQFNIVNERLDKIEKKSAKHYKKLKKHITNEHSNTQNIIINRMIEENIQIKEQLKQINEKLPQTRNEQWQQTNQQLD